MNTYVRHEEIPNVTVPEGHSGDWSIERFQISEDQAKMYNLRALFSGTGNRSVEPGIYTRLIYNGRDTVMSDTPAEKRDHRNFVYRACGTVLINGLGLGMVVQACLLKPEVTSVTVIESSYDVISLVAPYYQDMFGSRFKVIHADALTYKPSKGERYNFVWHDIWTDICADNWEQYKTLNRKWGRHCDFQYSWCRYDVLQEVRDEKLRNYWRKLT